jgi:hypothetical protein
MDTMRNYSLIFLSLFSLSAKTAAGARTPPLPDHYGDTSVIIHINDGSLNEWPDDRFTTDKESNIAYAIDNDSHNLYLALKVSNRGEQVKISRMGMKLFLDMKGKKKETRGIEFPVKGENGGFRMENTGGNQNDQQENRQDAARMKAMFRLSAVTMKLFGFEGQADEQGLVREGSANIAFNWDSTNSLGIEYIIPLALFHEDMNDLNQRTISIGWKINGMDASSFSGNNNNFGGGEGGGGFRGGRGGGGGGGGFRSGRTESNSGGNQQFDREKFMKEQELWAKYTFNLPKS